MSKGSVTIDGVTTCGELKIEYHKHLFAIVKNNRVVGLTFNPPFDSSYYKGCTVEKLGYVHQENDSIMIELEKGLEYQSMYTEENKNDYRRVRDWSL